MEETVNEIPETKDPQGAVMNPYEYIGLSRQGPGQELIWNLSQSRQ